MMHHQKLADTTLDQLALASIHFLRNHFQVIAVALVQVEVFTVLPFFRVARKQPTFINVCCSRIVIILL